MTLWQLKTFATVAREGSFTKAGKVLNISQPSVSSLVIGLQKELGIKLFDKLGMRPRLTEAGRLLLKRAESVLGITEKIPEEMEQVKGLKKGRIRVGGSPVAAATFLPQAVQTFKEQHPGIDVILLIQRSDSLGIQLLEGELDLAILGRPVRSSLLVGTSYREEEIVAIASPGHPLAKKRLVPLELIAKEPLIVPAKGGPLRDMIERKFAERKLPFMPALEIDTQYGGRDALRSAWQAALGSVLHPGATLPGRLRRGG
jgi:DNA-binding transcriptional LysR family regulator